MGPLVSAEQRDKVEGYIKSGIDEGAKLVLGGKRPTASPMNKGYYVVPTIFTNVTQTNENCQRRNLWPGGLYSWKSSTRMKR